MYQVDKVLVFFLADKIYRGLMTMDYILFFEIVLIIILVSSLIYSMYYRYNQSRKNMNRNWMIITGQPIKFAKISEVSNPLVESRIFSFSYIYKLPCLFP